MTRHLLSYVLAPLLLVALGAQQAPQVPTPTSQAPAAVTEAGPAQQPSASILPDGTPMKLRLLNTLDSQTSKTGDEIQFAVVNDVVVGGVTVLRRASPATGVVTLAEANKTLGRPGKLNFIINNITLLNGGKVPVRAFNRRGENFSDAQVAATIYLGLVYNPFFLFVHGTNTTFPRGTEITAFVDGDLRLDLASFAAAPSADRANDELKTALQISSNPDDAQVQIDGAAAGNTPVKVTVMAGKHEILIKKTGYSDWSKSLYVSGSTAHVEAVLEALTAQ